MEDQLSFEELKILRELAMGRVEKQEQLKQVIHKSFKIFKIFIKIIDKNTLSRNLNIILPRKVFCIYKAVAFIFISID